MTFIAGRSLRPYLIAADALSCIQFIDSGVNFTKLPLLPIYIRSYGLGSQKRL